MTMKKLLNNNNRIESSGQPAASGVEWPAGIPAPLPQILLARTQSPECEWNAIVVRYEELKLLTRSKKKKKTFKNTQHSRNHVNGLGTGTGNDKRNDFR